MTTTKSTYVPPEAREHEARFVHVVCAGKHTPANDRFNKGSTPRLYITYELVDEQKEDGMNKWLQGFNYQQPMNNYGGERGGRFDLLNKMGFSSNEDEDLKSLPNMQCWVGVTHSEWQGKTYANMGTLNRCSPRDGEFAPLHNPAIFFDVYNPVVEDWNNLPKWIKDYCLAADDADETGIKEFADEARKSYKSTDDTGTTQAAKAGDSGTVKAAPAAVSGDDDDEDVPF
ncbi:MAG: hypothetical protein HRU12_19725 [Phaeodactylibacter sp.]|nr:hypothetical protein [Phaeodactylibacter sp.]